MPRYRAWGLAAAVAAGLAPAAVAADASKPPTTLFAKWFGPKPKPKSVARGSTPPTVVAPLAPEVLQAALNAEQEAWIRRVNVCSKLREIANDKRDDALMRQADELERQATVLYNERTEALGVPRMKVVDRKRESGKSMVKLDAPTAPVAIDAGVREVQP
ncbi:MAG TPA: hypothetical protein VGI99_10545 [Gemmataceae bacterium]